MSIRIRKVLVCDHCGMESDGVDKKCKPDEVRSFFPTWYKFMATHDYCPKCWPEIRRRYPALTAQSEGAR